MWPRFFAPDLDSGTGTATLPADEARHLTRVMRLAAGDIVAVFDGRGREFRARVAEAARDRVRLDLLEAIVPAAEPRIAVTLVQAVLKGDRMDAVIRDATMVGVAAIEPIVTTRIAGHRAALESGRAVDRWHRVAVSSAKQCRRATLPSIGPGRTLAGWLADDRSEMRLILVEPAAADGGERSFHALENQPSPASVALLVGPEGGWTEEERQQARSAGCQAVTLGGLTLRADAIGIVAIAVLRFVLRDV